MARELKIVWSGDVPGLVEHRLSVSHFSESLTLFLGALRRIATSIVGDALEGGEYSERGRLANVAKQLDIEIIGIEGGSTGVATVLSFTPPSDQTISLFDELPDRAATELLRAIEDESKGRLRSAAVRRYLKSLPQGVKRQEYQLRQDGREIYTVKIDHVDLADLPDEIPFLRQIDGDITGVGFEPGKNEVRVKSGSGQTAALGANHEQVDTALQLRGNRVRTLSLISKKTKLLRIENLDSPSFTVTPEAVEEHIFRRWNGLLQRLAK